MDELMDRMASLVCLNVSELMSVIAILVQPERAKPFATAAPMPAAVSAGYYMLLCSRVTCSASAGDDGYTWETPQN